MHASFPFGFECGIWDLILLVPDHGISFTLHFGFEGEIWDLIVLVPDHCISFCPRCLVEGVELRWTVRRAPGKMGY